jgi:hypothetical protein
MAKTQITNVVATARNESCSCLTLLRPWLAQGHGPLGTKELCSCLTLQKAHFTKTRSTHCIIHCQARADPAQDMGVHMNFITGDGRRPSFVGTSLPGALSFCPRRPLHSAHDALCATAATLAQCWRSLQQIFDRQNLRFERSIWQISCIFLVLIKFHELCCEFHGQVHILGEIGTNVPHEQGTAEPPGLAGPAGMVGPAPWLVPSPEHLLSLEQHLEEHDSLKNVSLIQRWRLESMGPLVRPLNRHNRHSEVILGVPERRRCITRHEGGRTAPIHPCVRWNRPKEPTFNRLRSTDQGRPRREAVDHRGRPHLLIRPHLTYCPNALHRPSLPIKGTSHSLDWKHNAGASPFPSFVHLE